MLKKTTKYKEINHRKRLWYLRELRSYIREYGSKNIIYFDESGFAHHAYRTHGWARRGTKVHGKIPGNNYARTNLIMAQRENRWMAPMLFEGTCHKEVVNSWVKQILLPELKEPSLVIMDNARFHDKKVIAGLLEEGGHKLMPLPPYSPDFNPIEKSFAIIKKLRSLHQQPLESIIMSNYILN